MGGPTLTWWKKMREFARDSTVTYGEIFSPVAYSSMKFGVTGYTSVGVINFDMLDKNFDSPFIF